MAINFRVTLDNLLKTFYSCSKNRPIQLALMVWHNRLDNCINLDTRLYSAYTVLASCLRITNAKSFYKIFIGDLLHHSWFSQTCASSNICTLYPPLKEYVHKMSPCHLYKHRTEGGPVSNHQKNVQLVGISASGISVISPRGVFQGILVLHFESGCPRKSLIKHSF